MSNSLLLLSAIIAMTYAISMVTCQTPVPTTCREYSASCGRCNMAPLNCRYVWTRSGTFNSSGNGTCLSQDVVDQLLWYNEYNKTVYAYALKEDEVNSPRGQYLLTKRDSFQLYNSEAVTCWDRHLCYCKPPAPAPPNRISVFVYDCRTGLPINGASVNLTGTNLTAAVTRTVNSSGLTEYFPLPAGAYFVSVSNTGYNTNGSDFGVLMYNESRNASICLSELPCILTVVTYDSTTNATLSGVTVTLNSQTLSPQTTDANGRTSYTFNADVASSATGVRAGYTSASSSFTCGRNGSVTVNLYLTPIPGAITVCVYDARTGSPIPGANAALSGGASRSNDVGANGCYQFTPLQPGFYNANATASGYLPNGTVVGQLSLNQTLTANIYLTELPCTVITTVYDLSTNQTLTGATVSVNSASVSSQTTGANGQVTFSFNYDVATSVSATKTGYTSASSSFTCARNRTVTVNLYIAPVLNTLIVIVRDIRTNAAITTATVSISGLTGSTRTVDGAGSVTYSGVPAGNNYVASASAPGYSSNSTNVPALTFNQTVTVIIYLAEIPCTVLVTVYDTSTNATLNAAVVSLNSANITSVTTGPNGQATWSFNFDAATAVTATKTGYTTASSNFVCSRNTTVSINLFLSPVLNTLIVIVRDIRTNALITTASVAVSGFATTPRAVDAAGSVTYQGIPAGNNYVASASAPGYNSNSTNVPELTFNQTVTVTIYLAEVPCQVIVTVYDTSTNATLNAAVVSLNSANITSVTTGPNGQATWSFNYDAATAVTATKTGYTTASSNFVCTRNGTVSINLFLSPVLNTLIVIVRDIRTNALITTASVAVSGFATTPRAVDAAGSVTYQGIPAGNNYVASASAPGYNSNSTNVPALTFNQTVTVTIYLGEQPCVVTVITRDNSTGALLSGVAVSLNGTGSNAQTTDASGTVSFSITFDAANGVSGVRTGYTSAFSTFTCTRSGNVTVTLFLAPLPNTIIVQVRDADDNSLITNATVVLTGGSSFSSSQRVDVNATAYFYQIASGTYFANASAPLYFSNGTSVGQVSFNETRFVIIYLRRLPCTVRVTVFYTGTRDVVPDASVQFDSDFTDVPPSQVYTTNANGQVTISQPARGGYDAVVAFKSGYRNGSDSFECSPGGTVDVELFLEQFFQIFVAAVDTFTPSRPLIRQAQILLNGTTVTETLPGNVAIKIQEVSSLPVTYVIQGIAKGYLQQQITTTFNLTRLTYNISLSPRQYTLGFGISQLFDDGTEVQFTTGQVTSGFQPGPGTTYVPKPGDLGGEAIQEGSPPRAAAFTNQPFDNQTQFIAIFPDILPTSVSPFSIQRRNISLLAPNWNNSVGNSVLQFVPNFDQIEERELKFLLPYRLNSGFIIVRVTPYNNAKTTPVPFTGQFTGVQLFLRDSSNYQNLNALTSSAAAYEFLVTFGSHVNDFYVNYPGETFDIQQSNWVNPTTNQIYDQSVNVTRELFDFDFPTPQFINNVFTILPNGQWARKRNSQIYIIFDYRLVYLTKKRTTNN